LFTQCACPLTPSHAATDLPQTYHYNLNKPKWYTKQASSVTKGQKKQLSLHSPQFLVPTPAQFGTKLVFQSLYPTPGPLIFEIGFGLGANILSMARHNPSSNFLGAEIHRSSLSQCMATAAEMGCTNVKLYGGDAVKLLKNNMEDSALDQVIILFPDPWLTDGSMDKQHKGGNHDSASAVVPDASSAASSTASSADPAGDRRVVCPETIDIIYAKLKPEGLLHIATDADSYAIHVDTLMGDRKDFVGGIVDAPEWRRQAETKYEKRAKEELGHVVRDFCFVKQ